jgi:hypothetical protein
MPNSCFDPNDFIVPHRDPDGRTVRLSVDLHPGQVRIIEYLLSMGKHGITDQEALLRWCVCWGLHALLDHPPNAFALTEAKLNVLQDEVFEQQQYCLSTSVHKYLAAGNVEAARRVVNGCIADYGRISCGYWRNRWISTLAESLDQLQRRGIRVELSR